MCSVRDMIQLFENNRKGDNKLNKSKSYPNLSTLRTRRNSTVENIEGIISVFKKTLDDYREYDKQNHLKIQENIVDLINKIIDIEDVDDRRKLLKITLNGLEQLSSKLPETDDFKYKPFSTLFGRFGAFGNTQRSPIATEPTDHPRSNPMANFKSHHFVVENSNGVCQHIGKDDNTNKQLERTISNPEITTRKNSNIERTVSSSAINKLDESVIDEWRSVGELKKTYEVPQPVTTPRNATLEEDITEIWQSVGELKKNFEDLNDRQDTSVIQKTEDVAGKRHSIVELKKNFDNTTELTESPPKNEMQSIKVLRAIFESNTCLKQSNDSNTPVFRESPSTASSDVYSGTVSLCTSQGTNSYDSEYDD